MDEQMKHISGIQCFFSALTATAALNKKKSVFSKKYNIYPSVGYWVVSCDGSFDERLVYNEMQRNNLGSTMKLTLQPYQKEEKVIANSLCQIMKDNQEGLVKRMVKESVLYNLGNEAWEEYPLVKVFVRGPEVSSFLRDICDELQTVRFPVQLEQLADTQEPT